MKRAQEILQNLERVKSEIPAHVNLIVVTKNFPISDIEILYQAGVRDFGENRDQEGVEKAKNLPQDIRWHFQGQIQSNKIKSLIEWASVIHSLDDIDHAQKINKRLKVPIEVFAQVSLDGQEHRGGVEPKKLDEFIHSVSKLPMLKISGLMAVAPVNLSPDIAFANLQEIFQGLDRKSTRLNSSHT